MVPAVASRMVAGGTAELFPRPEKAKKAAAAAQPESTTVEPAAERAVAPAQNGPTKKSRLSRN